MSSFIGFPAAAQTPAAKQAGAAREESALRFLAAAAVTGGRGGGASGSVAESGASVGDESKESQACVAHLEMHPRLSLVISVLIVCD